jgi:hypothetical protein
MIFKHVMSLTHSLLAKNHSRGNGYQQRTGCGQFFVSVTFGFDKMPKSDTKRHLEEDICIHIFTISAAMVGACLTVMGIFRILIHPQNINTISVS